MCPIMVRVQANAGKLYFIDRMYPNWVTIGHNCLCPIIYAQFWHTDEEILYIDDNNMTEIGFK